MFFQWHRLLGLSLIDLMSNTCYEVELERDLSTQQQLLDVLIINKHQGNLPEVLPDGLDNLKQYNLITYKSHQDTLSLWAIEELISHFVSYRKIVSSNEHASHTNEKPKKLIPYDQFQLYALTAHHPKALAKAYPLTAVRQGVYELAVLSNTMRIIVLRELPKTANNTIWHLFSGDKSLIEFSAKHHRWKQQDVSRLTNRIFEQYGLEGILMAYTMEQFLEEEKQALLNSLTPEERLRGLDAETRLQGLDAETRLQGLGAEERLRGLDAKTVLEQYDIKERLQGLSPEQIEAYLLKLKRH